MRTTDVVYLGKHLKRYPTSGATTIEVLLGLTVLALCCAVGVPLVRHFILTGY